jgi:hypothetical protein
MLILRHRTDRMPTVKEADLHAKVKRRQVSIRKKSDPFEFLHPPKDHETIEFLKWCTHEELNLKPADP